MMRSVPVFRCRGRSSVSGANVFSNSEPRGCRTKNAAGARPSSPPDVVVQIKAMACELPATRTSPRKPDGCWISTKASGRTKPWAVTSLSFPPTSGIAPFGALVREVMTQSPNRGAKRVFWIVDNGSSHRGEAACRRLQGEFANLVLVHLPVHASWLNQIEIYFSVVQRKALTPNDFPSLPAVVQRLIGFQHYYEQVARPFEWKFTRADLAKLLLKLQPPAATAQAA